MRNLIAILGAVLLAVMFYFGWQFLRVQQAAVRWEGKVPEILSENIKKEGDVSTIELTSRIDAPVDAVFAAFQNPERSEGRVPQIKKAAVVESDGSRKRVEFHLTTLGQLQVMTVDLSYDAAGKKVGIKTVEGATEIDGSYDLAASPDGGKTLVTYRAKQRNKLPLPIPESVEKSAIKEQFANLMCAIQKDLKEQGKLQGEVTCGTAA